MRKLQRTLLTKYSGSRKMCKNINKLNKKLLKEPKLYLHISAVAYPTHFSVISYR